METPAIRRLGIDDIDILMDWRMRVIKEVFDLPDGYDMSAMRQANLQYYWTNLPSHRHIAVIADLDGEPVGCGGLCLYDEMPSPENPHGQCGYLMNIYVTPALREKGIGTEIVKWLAKEARKHGCGRVFLETTEAGLHVYQEIGFKPMKGFMALPTDQEL